MANTEIAPPFPSPFGERLGHRVEAIRARIGSHWKSLSLAAAAALGAGYLFITHDRGPQNPPQPTTPASDIFPDSEIGVIIPTTIPPSIETPTFEIGYQINKDGGLNYVSETDEVLNVPQIAGLRAELIRTELRNGQPMVVYNAEPGNPYGLEANAYAGTFNPNVSVENKQTGGVVLVAPVVLKLMGTYTNGLGLPLPLAVSEDQAVAISFTAEQFYGNDAPRINLSLSGRAALTNIINAKELRFVRSLLRDETGESYYWQYSRPTSRIINPNTPLETKPYVLFLPVPGKFTNNITLPSQLGETIQMVENSTVIVCHTEAEQNKRKLTPNDVLNVGVTPVFLATNAPALSMSPNQSLDQQLHPHKFTAGGFPSPRYAPRKLPV